MEVIRRAFDPPLFVDEIGFDTCNSKLSKDERIDAMKKGITMIVYPVSSCRCLHCLIFQKTQEEENL
jgi:hypothetical protein